MWQLGTLNLTCSGVGPKTYEFKERLRRYYGPMKSKVSEIDSEDLASMLEGFFGSVAGWKGKYGGHLIPMVMCSTGLVVIVDTELTIDNMDIRKLSYISKKAMYLLGTPNIVEGPNGKLYFEWIRNIVSWF